MSMINEPGFAAVIIQGERGLHAHFRPTRIQASMDDLGDLVRTTTCVKTSLHLPSHSVVPSDGANGPNCDFGDLLGHNRNPNMSKAIRPLRANRCVPPIHPFCLVARSALHCLGPRNTRKTQRLPLTIAHQKRIIRAILHIILAAALGLACEAKSPLIAIFTFLSRNTLSGQFCDVV
jgi:hypothetical protein